MINPSLTYEIGLRSHHAKAVGMREAHFWSSSWDGVTTLNPPPPRAPHPERSEGWEAQSWASYIPALRGQARVEAPDFSPADKKYGPKDRTSLPKAPSAGGAEVSESERFAPLTSAS